MSTELMTSVERVNAAATACGLVQAKWAEAYEALAGSVATNGYGIYRDPLHLRAKLTAARAAADEALRLLAVVQWPSGEDYDRL